MKNFESSKIKIYKLMNNQKITHRSKCNDESFHLRNEEYDQVEHKRERREHSNHLLYNQSMLSICRSSSCHEPRYRTKESNESSIITFQVDFASTPKKVLPRSSTPMARKTSNRVRKSEKQHNIIDELNCCRKRLIIERIKMMRKQAKFRAQKKLAEDKNVIVNPLYFDHSKLNQSVKFDSLESWDKLKYPVCFLPNQKTQDMDRINNGVEIFGPSIFTYTLI